MLVLIADITGGLGHYLATFALFHNHTVRGLDENRKSLALDIVSRLKSFAEVQSYYDAATIDKACRGVNAKICGFRSVPELELGPQLVLLRAAEKADFKIFVSSTWNNDCTQILLGDFEHYDAHIPFKR